MVNAMLGVTDLHYSISDSRERTLCLTVLRARHQAGRQVLAARSGAVLTWYIGNSQQLPPPMAPLQVHRWSWPPTPSSSLKGLHPANSGGGRACG